MPSLTGFVREVNFQGKRRMDGKGPEDMLITTTRVTKFAGDGRELRNVV